MLTSQREMENDLFLFFCDHIHIKLLLKDGVSSNVKFLGQQRINESEILICKIDNKICYGIYSNFFLVAAE